MGEKMRLDRFLSECGKGTRSEVKTYIKKGNVTINGNVVKDNSTKVDVEEDRICLFGSECTYEKYLYFMLNKPQGCVSATRDGLSTTVLEYLEGEITKGLFPVGRLDKDTEGFLLITNDGALGHNLLSPKKHVDKTYIAVVDKELSEEDMKTFESGVDIGDEELTLPASIEALEAKVYKVVIHEGRYHQIKRMFEAFGSHVTALKRVSMGEVSLDERLAPGEYRRLTEEELSALRREK